MNRLMKFFTYDHLSAPLREVSYDCFVLAAMPESAEKTAGLRKLLEAKDCFVRARLEKLEDKESGDKDGPA